MYRADYCLKHFKLVYSCTAPEKIALIISLESGNIFIDYYMFAKTRRAKWDLFTDANYQDVFSYIAWIRVWPEFRN